MPQRSEQSNRRNNFAASQVPNGNAKCCTPSPQFCQAIRLLNRRINNGLCCFPDDAQGEALLMIQRKAGGLPPDQIDRDAPWFRDRTEQDQRRQNEATRCFSATPENIVKLLEATTAPDLVTPAKLKQYAHERVKCRMGGKCAKCRNGVEHWKYPMRQLLQIIPDDPGELRKREQKKNDTRKAARQKAKAERMAQYDPREAALIEAVIRISHQDGCLKDFSVPNIVRSIERSDDRAAFPHKRSTLHVAVHDVLNRLVRRRVMKTVTTEKPGRRTRLVAYCSAIDGPLVLDGLNKAIPPKPLSQLELALDENDPDLNEGWGHESSNAERLGEAGRGQKQTTLKKAPNEKETKRLRRRVAVLSHDDVDGGMAISNRSKRR